MKAIQTFWSAGKDLLNESFGWKTPEYNLMSWTMSCHSLRQHFDEVELYTDTIGYKLLIETLELPYTKVHLIFDDFQCLPQHWALAKIKTYSLQTKPFLHVDGDIFLPNPIPVDVLAAPVITQNKEIVTQYYMNMMDFIFNRFDFSFPKFTEKAIKEGTLDSYNMGFFGGNDLDFIHRYCDEVFRFVETNQINNPNTEQSKIICNIFFEQVMLAAFADNEHQDIVCVHPAPVADNGYTIGEFSNFDVYERMPFLHVLGGHKRNRVALETMERAMFAFYPDLYMKIMSLFPWNNVRFSDKKKIVVGFPSGIPIPYMDFGWKQIVDWQEIPCMDLFSLQKRISRGRHFLNLSEEEQDHCQLTCNPYLALYETRPNCTEEQLKIFRTYLRCNDSFPLDYVVLFPMLQKLGFKEIPISEITFEIINLFREHDSCMMEVRKDMMVRNHITSKDDVAATTQIVNQEITSLLLSGVLIINN